MHFHLNKHEVFYIIEGTLRLDLIDTEIGEEKTIFLNKEESYEVEQGQPHQLIAYQGAVKIIEASTYHEDTDSYRVYTDKEFFKQTKKETLKCKEPISKDAKPTADINYPPLSWTDPDLAEEE